MKRLKQWISTKAFTCVTCKYSSKREYRKKPYYDPNNPEHKRVCTCMSDNIPIQNIQQDYRSIRCANDDIYEVRNIFYRFINWLSEHI